MAYRKALDKRFSICPNERTSGGGPAKGIKMNDHADGREAFIAAAVMVLIAIAGACVAVATGALRFA